MRDSFEYAWREITRRKRRTVASILGYVSAVTIMVVLASVLLFAKDAADAVLNEVGTHFIAFIPRVTSTNDPQSESTCCSWGEGSRVLDVLNEGFVATNVPSSVFTTRIIEKVKKLPTVADASPGLLFRFNTPPKGPFTVAGIDPTSLAASTACAAEENIVAGRFFSAADDAPVAILEESFSVARALSVGDSITVAETEFEIIGISNAPNRPAKADVYMTLESAEIAINQRLQYPLFEEANVILVESAGAGMHRQATEDVQAILGSRSLISGYACWSPAARTMGLTERGVWLSILIIGISVLILSLKTQYASVIERQHDIGIMKTIGWSDGNVTAQIFLESVLQAAIGGVGGCLLAIVILLVVPIEMLSGIEAVTGIAVSLPVLAAAMVLSLVGGAIAGMFPALSAARQQPADSLRRL